MSEYLSKKALLESIGEAYQTNLESPDQTDWDEGYRSALRFMKRTVLSGAFDADESEGTWKATAEVLGRENAQMNSEIQRLRAALEKARQYVVNGYELGYIDDREGYTEALVLEIDKALSTTSEPTNKYFGAEWPKAKESEVK